MRSSFAFVASFALAMGCLAAEVWKAPELTLPETVQHPLVACTAEEVVPPGA